jgi:hypothetical protein
MATRITIEADDRRTLEIIEQFIQFVATGLSGQIAGIAREQQNQRALLFNILRKEDQLMSQSSQLEQDLADAVDAIASEEATIEEKVNAALTMLQANPSASGVQAAVNKLKEIRARQGAFAESVPGGTASPSGSTGAGAPATSGGAGAGAATGGPSSVESSVTPPAGETSSTPATDTPGQQTEGGQ